MLGWFRKKSAPLTPEIQKIYDQCVTVCTRTWRELNPKTTTEEQLAHEIEGFGSSATAFIYTKFPIMKQAPPNLLWLIVFTAVLESNTHPAADVNKAIDMLRAKYAH
jgi:hypothetical protein